MLEVCKYKILQNQQNQSKTTAIIYAYQNFCLYLHSHYIFLINNLNLMFFELQDVKRRHMPAWSNNNVTMWTTALDSTPSWNYQRGVMIGLFACSIQQYLNHFVTNAKLMLKHYQPPTNFNQAKTFVQQTLKLQSYTQGIKSRSQRIVAGAFLDVGAKIALLRQWNSGWSSNFGGFETNYYRKIPTFLFPMIVSSPLGVVFDMTDRAFKADKTFPKQLQKGYKSWFDTFRRIPLEQGPYFFFKNSFPFYAKHILGPFTAFYTFDWLKDKASIMWRTSNTPMWPTIWIAAGFSTYLGAVFSYPFAHTARQMVDFWPKKNGVDVFQGNYRKAATWLWFSAPTWNISFPGFVKNYFWNVFPLWFFTILAADHFGIFSYWRIDIMSGAGDNTNQDSDI